MFDPFATGPALATDEVAGWSARLATGAGPAATAAMDDATRIDLVRRLEELKSAAAAAQAALTVAFVDSQRAAQRAAGVPEAEVGRGVNAQVALARRESPHKAARLVGLAQVLVHEMPLTFAALRAGRTSEWRATLVARGTACLSKEDRATADQELAPLLATAGDGEIESKARKVAYRLDPAGFTDRSRKVSDERRVTLRPAPDTMTWLTALLPVAQGVAAYAALRRAADGAKANGDERTRGQVMADTLVERVTGQRSADAVPVEVQLVMTDRALLEPGLDDPGGDEPAELVGAGPLPAPMARALVRETSGKVWLRRLFTRPGTGELVGMESRRRLFPEGLRRFLVVRDQRCRTPWCGAPVRHADHVVSVALGGPTSAANGAGLCEACNYAKQAPGWTYTTAAGDAGEGIVVTTPTGRHYLSRPPGPPGSRPPPVHLFQSLLGLELHLSGHAA